MKNINGFLQRDQIQEPQNSSAPRKTKTLKFMPNVTNGFRIVFIEKDPIYSEDFSKRPFWTP